MSTADAIKTTGRWGPHYIALRCSVGGAVAVGWCDNPAITVWNGSAYCETCYMTAMIAHREAFESHVDGLVQAMRPDQRTGERRTHVSPPPEVDELGAFDRRRDLSDPRLIRNADPYRPSATLATSEPLNLPADLIGTPVVVAARPSFRDLARTAVCLVQWWRTNTVLALMMPSYKLVEPASLREWTDMEHAVNAYLADPASYAVADTET